MAAVFACQWAQVHLHARAVRSFLDQFNRLAIHEALAPTFLPHVGIGLRPVWLVGAAAMIAIGSPWGAVMMLAGAVQRRYGRAISPVVRQSLANRLREMASLRGPMLRAPTLRVAQAVPAADNRCAAERCQSPLPAGARYCPRCGINGETPHFQRPSHEEVAPV